MTIYFRTGRVAIMYYCATYDIVRHTLIEGWQTATVVSTTRYGQKTLWLFEDTRGEEIAVFAGEFSSVFGTGWKFLR